MTPNREDITLPEALLLADALDKAPYSSACTNAAADELRRLNEVNVELLEALSEIAHGLESARIWGGLEWTYNTLHPVKYLPLRDKARTAIAKVRGEQK